LKILFVDQFSETGGAQLCLLDIVSEAVRRGWLAEIMMPGDAPLRQACANRGIPTSELRLSTHSNGRKPARDILRFGAATLRSSRMIREASVRLGADLIYVNGPRTLPAAVLAARELKTPVIFHAHSVPGRLYARQIARWCIRSGSVRVVAISDFVSGSLSPPIDSRQIRTIYNGVPDHGFLPRPRTNPSRIGILGRISPEKGHLEFVQSAKQMVATRAHLRFLVFGATLFADAAFGREVRRAAERLPVEFRGWTENVAAALQEIDILAVPSGPREGATRVIMEAFSAGTPVVAYPSGGIPELVRHGETGLLTDSRESEALADAVCRLLDQPALMSKLSIQGRHEWENRFQAERSLSALFSFIAEDHRLATAISSTPISTTAVHSGTKEQETAHGGVHGAA
jgi:glycosyltransferase involved in cell wall biosynthesis